MVRDGEILVRFYEGKRPAALSLMDKEKEKQREKEEKASKKEKEAAKGAAEPAKTGNGKR